MHDLTAELDDEDTGLAELAEAELRDDYGPLLVDPLLEAMPEFGNFGILSAVELLEEFGDERAGPTLIALLDNEEHVVREWAARALGKLGIKDAIDPLKLAYERVKARRTPLHWTEPSTIRDALTSLGAREEIIPASAERLRLQRSDPTARHYWERYWERVHVAEVIDALADAVKRSYPSSRGRLASAHTYPYPNGNPIGLCHGRRWSSRRGAMQRRPSWPLMFRTMRS